MPAIYLLVPLIVLYIGVANVLFGRKYSILQSVLWPLALLALPWNLLSRGKGKVQVRAVSPSLGKAVRVDNLQAIDEVPEIAPHQWENYQRLLQQTKNTEEVNRLQAHFQRNPEYFTLENEYPALFEALLTREEESLLTPEELAAKNAEKEKLAKERRAKRAEAAAKAKAEKEAKAARLKKEAEELEESRKNYRVRTAYGRTAHTVEVWPDPKRNLRGFTVCKKSFNFNGNSTDELLTMDEETRNLKYPPCQHCKKELERRATLEKLVNVPSV